LLTEEQHKLFGKIRSAEKTKPVKCWRTARVLGCNFLELVTHPILAD